MKAINVVAAAIISNKKQILIARRGYGEFKGLWEFPGGKIKLNEKPKEALIREIKEELDADIEIKKYLTSVRWEYPNFNLHMKVYLCKLKTKNLILKEHLSYKWTNFGSLEKIKFLPADKSILNIITKKINDYIL